MDRALWLLYWLGFRSWLRRMLRGLRTVKGALSAALWVFILGSCILGSVISRFVMDVQAQGAPTGVSLTLEQVERYGSLSLTGLCLLSVLTNTGKGSIVIFLPAEVAFLLAGPFTRRQLLVYKLLTTLLAIGILSLFWPFLLSLGFLLGLPAGPLLARYLGFVLAFIFLQLCAMDLGSVALVIGAHAYSRARKVMLWVLGILAAAGVVYGSMHLPALGWGETLLRLEQTPVARAVLELPRWFIRAALAEHYWPDFALWGGVGLAVDALLLLLLFKLDAQYEEGAAVAGERVYTQIERIRTQGAQALLTKSSGTARWSLPSLPFWRGVGPVVWRQLQGMARSRFLYFTLVFAPLGMILIGGLMSRIIDDSKTPAVLKPIMFFAMCASLSFVLPATTVFDFRRDFDRMDVLKTLPIGSIPLVLGQILAPVLYTTLVQALCLAALAVRAGYSDTAVILCTLAPLVLPVSFLLVNLDNLVFLLCPTRPMNAMARGPQFSGQKLLLNMGKFLVLNIACAMAVGVALTVYYLSGRLFGVAIAAAWVVLATFAAGMVPLLALAFARFDVARDRPV